MPLRQLFPDPESSVGEPAKVDIIAVHGLNPRSKKDAEHAWDTWRTSPGSNGRLWLRDDLPKYVPDSRIFLYEYNATAVYGKDQDTFVGKANELLEAIRIKREDVESRPILLLGHSMGGLLIKQALINAHNNPKYTLIKDATTGLAFFATPHNGGDWKLVSLGGVAAKIAIAAGFQKGDNVLETLHKGSIFSDIMQEHWRHQLLNYDMISFWGSLDNIVPMHSARLGLPGDRENVVKLNADHESVCKFGENQTDQDNFEVVRSNIRDIYKNALNNHSMNGLNNLDVTYNMIGVIDAASRTLAQSDHFIGLWSEAPTEILRLRENVTRLWSLLDDIPRAGRNVVVRASANSVQGLLKDVELARCALKDIQSVLGQVYGESSASLLTRTSSRWVMHRDKVTRLQIVLADCRQRILTHLALLQLSVSTENFASMRLRSAVSRNPEPAIHHARPLLVENFDRRFDDVSLRIDGISGEFSHPQDCTPPTISSSRNMPADLPITVTGMQPPTMIDQSQVERRDHRNERRFQHIERSISTMTAILASPRPGFQHEPNAVPRPGRVACELSCRCRCHFIRNYGNWRLTAFQSVIGMFSFFFTGRSLFANPCSATSCKNYHPKWIRVTYTFPTWLLQTSITAVLGTSSGSPEFLLRVHRRLSFVHSGNTQWNITDFVRHGDVDNLKKILQRREASIFDVAQPFGTSLITLALEFKHIQVAKLLLQEGADLFQLDDRGHAAFQSAITQIYVDPDISLSYKRDLESLIPLSLAIDLHGFTDLHKVVLGISCLGLHEFLRLRLEDGQINSCDINNRTPLYYASASGDLQAVEALIEAGAKPDLSSSKGAIGALHIACNRGHLEVVRKLICAGANVNTQILTGKSPLLCIVPSVGKKVKEHPHLIEIAAELVRHGANINAASGMSQYTALDGACWGDFASLTDFLVKAGADMHHRDWEGSNSLMNAVGYNSCKAAAVLLNHSVDHRNVDYHGQSVLHYLALFAGVEMMDLFTRRGLSGLDVNLPNGTGITPMQCFESRQDSTPELREEFVRLLKSVSEIDESGVPPNAEHRGPGNADVEGQEEYFDAPEGLAW